jgi:hypothetical protein
MKRVANGVLFALATGSVACSSAPAGSEPEPDIIVPLGRGAQLPESWSCLDSASLPPAGADAVTLWRARSANNFMNVAPGFVFAQGLLPNYNRVFGSASAIVRVGEVTNVEMRPY